MKAKLLKRDFNEELENILEEKSLIRRYKTFIKYAI